MHARYEAIAQGLLPIVSQGTGGGGPVPFDARYDIAISENVSGHTPSEMSFDEAHEFFEDDSPISDAIRGQSGPEEAPTPLEVNESVEPDVPVEHQPRSWGLPSNETHVSGDATQQSSGHSINYEPMRDTGPVLDY